MRLFFLGPRIFGIRPGISVRPGELLNFDAKAFRRSHPPEMKGSFLYVFKGDHNLAKVGVSTNPDARLAQLRTASPFPIDYAFVGVTPGAGYDIERVAHGILAGHRCNGEWFDVPPEMAVAAVHTAANRIGQPLQPLEPWMVAEIHRIGALEDAVTARARPPVGLRFLWRLFQIIVGALVVLITIGVIWMMTIALRG
jgi:hypothetical protein